MELDHHRSNARPSSSPRTCARASTMIFRFDNRAASAAATDGSARACGETATPWTPKPAHTDANAIEARPRARALVMGSYERRRVRAVKNSEKFNVVILKVKGTGAAGRTG